MLPLLALAVAFERRSPCAVVVAMSVEILNNEKRCYTGDHALHFCFLDDLQSFILLFGGPSLLSRCDSFDIVHMGETSGGSSARKGGDAVVVERKGKWELIVRLGSAISQDRAPLSLPLSPPPISKACPQLDAPHATRCLLPVG